VTALVRVDPHAHKAASEEQRRGDGQRHITESIIEQSVAETTHPCQKKYEFQRKTLRAVAAHPDRPLGETGSNGQCRQHWRAGWSADEKHPNVRCLDERREVGRRNAEESDADKVLDAKGNKQRKRWGQRGSKSATDRRGSPTTSDDRQRRKATYT
jgi:hypothetical protein